MIKHSHLNDYFSKQTSPADHKSQSCGSKGRDLYIPIITASYWPLITFLLGIRYLVGYLKRGGGLGCVYQQNISESERRSKETHDRIYQVYRKGLPTGV